MMGGGSRHKDGRYVICGVLSRVLEVSRDKRADTQWRLSLSRSSWREEAIGETYPLA